MVNLAGKINIYDCPQCGFETGTIHLVHGVTPMLLGCKSTRKMCRGMAISRMYRNIPPGMVPEWEWYKPDDAELKSMSPEMQDHVERGGLQIRPRNRGDLCSL